MGDGERSVSIGKDATNVKIDTGNKTVYEAAAPIVSALHQLPQPPADFTGREIELNELRSAIGNGGVTISGLQGLGGVGKTALALKLAEGLKSQYPDAQFYLDLKGADAKSLSVSDALSHVIRAYHPTAKLPEGEAELRGLYNSVLEDKRALLLMDNAKDAVQVFPLIPPKSCVMIVTSRLHFDLPGLSAKNLNSLPMDDAKKLLLKIAERIGDNAEAIAKLCGCLPLALTLAASTLKVKTNLSPSDYVRRLGKEEERIKLLDKDSGKTTANIGVEASLSASYELLTEENRRKWAALSVFPDTFDCKAAAAVWQIDEDSTTDALSELMSFSLIEYNETTERYRLHDLVRLYAAGRQNADERGASRNLHAVYYLDVLWSVHRFYEQGGEAITRGLSLFDLEWENIRIGHTWALANSDANDDAAALCIGYPDAGVHVLDLRQHPHDRIRWLEAAVAAARCLKRRSDEGAFLGNLGIAYAVLGETRRAIEFYEQQLVIGREVGYRRSEGNALGNLGTAYDDLGETRRAIEFYEQYLAIAREIGDRRGEGIALGNIGIAYKNLGETRRAIEFYEQWLIIAHEIGDRSSEGSALGNLGSAYCKLGEICRAIEFYEQCLVITREIGDRRGEGNALSGLGVSYGISGENRKEIGSTSNI